MSHACHMSATCQSHDSHMSPFPVDILIVIQTPCTRTPDKGGTHRCYEQPRTGCSYDDSVLVTGALGKTSPDEMPHRIAHNGRPSLSPVKHIARVKTLGGGNSGGNSGGGLIIIMSM